MSNHEEPTFTVKTAVIGVVSYVALGIIIAAPFIF